MEPPSASTIEIVRDPKRCAGDPTIAGTRICVHDVVGYVQVYGGDLELVVTDALPDLTVEQVRAVLDWYQENTEEIDTILEQRREDNKRILAQTPEKLRGGSKATA
jgi:uncharacterized protein (DUF433 family)